jgi:ferredoxin-NADP reductase/MOSC domain-containing protein YiiM
MTATLLSVNVGMPQDVGWHGRTVHTGIWKRPVDGPRRVRRLNIDGDGQGDLGGHGGEMRAVLVYQQDSYDHWARELGRTDLTPGAFGENLTVDGLADDDVCIGDRYRVGGVVLEVTQPRVTCYRVGIRLDEPRMAALLVAHRRPGFYCRVLDEGEVQAGQTVELVSRGPERVTVAEMDALLYLPGHAPDVLERALRIPALSPGWQGSLRALLDQAATGATGNTGLTGAVTAPAWPGFRPLRVLTTRRESAEVVSVVLGEPDGSAVPGWAAGQSLVVRLPVGDTPVLRNYSLSNAPGDHDFRIGVKREIEGVASGYVHARLHVGDLVQVAAPRGTFVLDEDRAPVILVSAGIGVTPVLGMLHRLVAAGSARPVWWLHGARNGDEHSFAVEARDLMARLPDGHLEVCYSRPLPTDRLGQDYTRRGRLDAATLATLDLPGDAVAYLCGPTEFTADLRAALLGAGLAGPAIHSEVFGAGPAITPGIVGATTTAPHPPAGPPGAGPAVAFARSGLTAAWDSGYGSLLDFAEACDIPTRWSCRTGVCHTCETGLLSGEVDHDPAPLDPPAEGNCLPCVARPTGPVVLDL